MWSLRTRSRHVPWNRPCLRHSITRRASFRGKAPLQWCRMIVLILASIGAHRCTCTSHGRRCRSAQARPGEDDVGGRRPSAKVSLSRALHRLTVVMEILVPSLAQPQKRRRLQQKSVGSAHPEFVAPGPIALAPSGGTHMQVPSVDPGSRLFTSLRTEVRSCASLVLAGLVGEAVGNRVGCPLCPWYTVGPTLASMEQHLSEDHISSARFSPSGTKQLRLCVALHEVDIAHGRHQGQYLARSAAIIRKQVMPPPAINRLCVDAHLRLLLDGDGPRFISSPMAAADEGVRRVGNVLYTRTFAEALLREICLNRGSLPETMTRLQGAFLLKGCDMAVMMPEHAKTMWNVVADLMESTPLSRWQTALVAAAFRQGDYAVLTLDGTMKISKGILGGCRRGLPSQRILTMRGATGFIVGMKLVSDESGSTLRVAMEGALPRSEEKEAVRFVVVDRTSHELQKELATVLPCLECVCLDPVHIVMRVKAVTSNRPNRLSEFLRRVMHKFSVEMRSSLPGIPWAWQGRPAPTPRETAILENVRQGNLGEVDLDLAEGVLSDPGAWRSREDYLLTLAAASTLHVDLMHRRLKGEEQTVRGVLVAACAFSRWASYANNSYMLSRIDPALRWLVPTGTTANEALHAELRNAMRQVYSVHAATLQIHLDVIGFSKRVAWEAARRAPSLRQLRQRAVLARVLSRPLLKADEWAVYSKAQSSQGQRRVVGKSVTLFSLQRKAQMALVRGLRRQQALKRRRLRDKRTVYSQRRQTHLLGGGAGWGGRPV